MELDLLTVRVIRAIAESGSITGAARVLGYSQPAVSQHLARCEERIGMPLVQRSGRSVRLTEAGSALARHAVAITAAIDAAGEELDELAGLRRGNVRVAAFPTASSTLVPRMLAVAAATLPGITVTYVEAEPPEAVQMLRDGTADLAITFSYPGDRGDPHALAAAGLDVHDLFSEPIVLAVPAGRPSVPHLADLASEQWIAGCPRCRRHLLAACEAAAFEPRITLETDNATAVLNLVASGLGVAMLPRLALVGSTIPDAVSIVEADGAGERHVHLVLAVGAGRVPSVAAVARILREFEAAELTTA
jgi:molybdate transport repressor ModE-like protein